MTYRLKKAVLRLTALLFALLLAGENFCSPSANAADNTRITFYRWRRVEVGSDLTRNGENDPHRLLMIWDGSHYCTGPSGFIWSDDDDGKMTFTNNYLASWSYPEWYRAALYLSTPWYSLGSLNSLYYYGYGNDNEWVFRVPVMSNDEQMGSFFKHYDEDFKLESDAGGAAKFQISGNASSWRIWHQDNDSGAYDEYLYAKGNVLKIEQSDDADKHTRFRLVDGYKISVPLVTGDAKTIQNEQVSVRGQPIEYIPAGETLTVKSGGVMVVDGVLLNDGAIKVEDGGMVIIKENSAILPFTKYNKNGGGFTSSGNVVLRKNAKLIGGGVNGIWIEGGLTLNNGLIMAECLKVKGPYLVENRADAKILAGYSLFYSLMQKIVDDAVTNNGKEAIRTSVPTSSISVDASTDIYLSEGQQKVDMPENAIYGSGSVEVRKAALLPENTPIIAIYTEPLDFRKGNKDFIDLICQAYVGKMKARSISGGIRFTDTFSMKEYDVDYNAYAYRNKNIIITMKLGSHEITLYEDEASQMYKFDPNLINNLVAEDAWNTYAPKISVYKQGMLGDWQLLCEGGIGTVTAQNKEAASGLKTVVFTLKTGNDTQDYTVSANAILSQETIKITLTEGGQVKSLYEGSAAKFNPYSIQELRP